MQSPKKLTATGAMVRGYQLLTTVAAPLVAAGFACSRRGRIRLGERLGGWERVASPLPWWFHGASVGEVQGLIPVFKRLSNASDAAQATLLSCASPTGLDRAGSLVTYKRILPFDAPWCVHRALSRTHAQRLVLTETELWPELLRQAIARGIECSVINGRISDYTVDWYRRLGSLVTPLLREMRHVCVPDDVQRSRYIELGVPEERVVVTGHTKYDVECVLPSPDERIAVRQRFFPGIGADEKIIALGSVRPGEENAWFQSIVEARGRGERVRLIVAPRHAEKFDYFWEKIQQLQIPATRWSFAEGTRASGSDILLLDAYGVLEQAYAASDLAFIGATLVDIGGHNPMEAAMFGTPLCVGPYTSVIEQVLEDLTREGGVLRLAGASDVSALVERLCAGDGAITLSGARARQAWQRHRGATDRVLSILQGT